jgi:hypothetical protein
MRPKWLFLAVFSISAGSSLISAAVQEPADVIKAGYVTEVHGPNEFALNKLVVVTDSTTTYRLLSGKESNVASVAQHAMQVGAYLQVQGTRDEKSHALHASLVQVRNDWNKKLSGFGVIETIRAEGDAKVIDADGYKIRITPATVLTYGDGISSLADVRPNSWVRYEGVRDGHGELVAEKAKFVRAKFSSFWGPAPNSEKKTHGQDPVPAGGARIDANGKMVDLKAKVRYGDAGGMCGWHKVSTDAALQERVLRVGTQIVPAYQKGLAEDDPAKVPFRFYVVEEEKVPSELVCVRGLILVPRKVAEKLENDDQLAALLADGVALNLQVQSTELRNQELGLTAAELATLGSAPATLAVFAGEMIVTSEIGKRLMEQRGRMALELMAAAGYDPWQAPEAWRLLASKKPPKASQPIPYPDRSGYQLSILRLQYAK